MTEPHTYLTWMLAIAQRIVGPRHAPRADHDRGAVSIEHVLWYAAAAISVAVVAAIIWSQVRSTASTPVQAPSAP